MNSQELQSWIQSEPPEEDIAVNEDGSQYIPIGRVESLLTEIDPSWSTQQFRYTITPYGTSLLLSGSVELVVKIHDAVVMRVGSASFFDTDYLGNQDYASTLLSECTKNAAKKLGARFGKNLNGRDMIKGKGKEKKQAVKVKPDASTLERYKEAMRIGDKKTVQNIESIYDILIDNNE